MKDKDGYILVEKEFTLRGYRFKFVKQLKNSWCIFENIKKIFDQKNIFNPGKKVAIKGSCGTKDYITLHLIKEHK